MVESPLRALLLCGELVCQSPMQLFRELRERGPQLLCGLSALSFEMSQLGTQCFRDIGVGVNELFAEVMQLPSMIVDRVSCGGVQSAGQIRLLANNRLRPAASELFNGVSPQLGLLFNEMICLQNDFLGRPILSIEQWVGRSFGRKAAVHFQTTLFINFTQQLFF